MADKKISALTAASTPLAGTEVLPIVQSGATVKVSAADITAGRDVAAASLAVGGLTPSTWATFKAVQVGPNAASAFVAGNGADSWFGDSAYYNSGWKYAYSGIAVSAYRQAGGVHYWYSAPSGTSGNALTWTLDWSLSTGNLVQGTAAKGVNFTANTPAAGMTSQLLNWYEEGTWTPTLVAGALTINNTACYYTRIGNQVTLFFDVTFPVQTNANDADLFDLPFTIKSNGGSAGAIATDRSTTDPTFAYGFNGQTRLRFSDGALAVLTLTQMSGKRVKGSFTYQV